ncbi:hypothetical protein AQ809_08220 [Burkholderia pseudomallei]|nr:hypothetical protein AQ734_13145 [Burkholderia pseudomallei]OMT43625.1 hypothetical protein AQ757_28635 [Burkholderia pseudomallei]OMT44052.1 hypothetical protein AQ758_07115 [Burkholderia pseudomallei]OMU33306.1 hypothetical protein AQ774_10530 [Burkholderia pseudomallei]OMU52311.1 hypothetical protein AQ777_12165 [Burkholderia pseudomallei]
MQRRRTARTRTAAHAGRASGRRVARTVRAARSAFAPRFSAILANFRPSRVTRGTQRRGALNAARAARLPPTWSGPPR